MMIHRIEKTSKETRVFSFDPDTGIIKPQVLSVSETNPTEYLKIKELLAVKIGSLSHLRLKAHFLLHLKSISI